MAAGLFITIATAVTADKPNWIWGAGKANENETVFFRKVIRLNKPVKSAKLTMSCDNGFEAFLNGKKVLAGGDWSAARTADVKKHLTVGRNIIAVRGWNDGSVAGLGAGASNTPLEILCAVLHRMGVEDGIDLYKIMDVAEDLVVPIMDPPIRVDRDALTLGYAGVYSSFMLFAKRAEAKYGVPARDLLVELGRRGTVGGQEDMIEDLALTMAAERAD